MRLYRTATGRWAGTQADATRAAAIDAAGRWEQVDIPTDKRGLIAFLNAMRPEPPAEAQTVEPRVADLSIYPEDAFAALPLAQQLHLAALAVENARDRIK